MIFYEGDEIRFRGQYAIILEVFEGKVHGYEWTEN